MAGKTIKKYEEMVRRLGKFQGEARYVPYYWEIYLDGGEDGEKDGILYFTVTQKDKVKFPELKRRKVVRLWETNDGFVVEVR